MDLSIDAILHIFFRLSPFILVCFFSLYSIFNKNVKGIIYLAGLLLACFMTILFGNFPELQKIDKISGFPVTALNKSCRMIEFSDQGPISYLPLGQTVLAYTLFFIGYPIIMDDFTQMNFNSRNMTIIVFFIILVIADFIWNFSKNCFGMISLLISLIIGSSIGLLWGYVIKTSGKDLQLFRDTTTSKSCNKESKKKHRCRPKVDTKIYPINSNNTADISGMCSDIAGNIYVCDSDDNNNSIVRKFTYYPETSISTSPYLLSEYVVAGTPEYDNDYSYRKPLKNIQGICVDNDGNIFFTEKDNHVIRKIDTTGNISIIAGTLGSSGKSGDGGLATSAKLQNPTGICRDNIGNIFFTDTGNNVIRMINTNGVISLFSGNYDNSKNSIGDDNIKSNLKNVFFNKPTGICTDINNNIYISDTENNRIRIINAKTSIITSFSKNTTGTELIILKPTDIIVHSNGNITFVNNNRYIVTFDNKQANINSTTIQSANVKICIDAQNPNNYYCTTANNEIKKNTNSDSNPTYPITIFSNPQGLCVNIVNQSIYVADTSNHVIRRIDTNMNITTFAGIPGKPTKLFTDTNKNNEKYQKIQNYVVNVEENIKAVNSTFNHPTDICSDNIGNIYVADSSNNVIRKIDVNGSITTHCGNGNDRTRSLLDTTLSETDKTRIYSTELAKPRNICVDSKGNIYATEFGQHMIKKIDVYGRITIFAGTVKSGSDDGTIPENATFKNPTTLFMNQTDDIFVIDNDGKTIRKISNIDTSTSTIFITENNLFLHDLYIDSNQNIYVTTSNNTVNIISSNNNIQTIVGNGVSGNTRNTIAKNSRLDKPFGISKDKNNNIFIVDCNNNTVRKTYQNTNFLVAK